MLFRSRRTAVGTRSGTRRTTRHSGWTPSTKVPSPSPRCSGLPGSIASPSVAWTDLVWQPGNWLPFLPEPVQWFLLSDTEIDMPRMTKRLPKSQNVVVWVDGISFFATVAQIRVGISPSPTTSMAVRDVLESLERSRAAGDRKSTRLNSSHSQQSRMPSSA